MGWCETYQEALRLCRPTARRAMSQTGELFSSTSSIAGVAMLRQKEFVQKPVHLQQGLAAQRHPVSINLEEPPVFQLVERLGESGSEVHAEFAGEIIPADTAQLELQDQLADKPFIRGRGQRAPDWELFVPDFGDIRLEIVMVLVVGSVDVSKGCHTEGEQIGSRP